MSAQLLGQAFSQLFGDDVQVAALSISDPLASASELELLALGKAAPSRTAEFSAGRTAARQALNQLQLPTKDILIGQHRQPLPPAGACISISHDKSDAAAAAASEEHWIGLGIDICDADSLESNLISSVCRGQDLDDLNADETLGQRAKLIFCLKEALFKAIYPQVGSWMDFSQSELHIDHRDGSYGAQLFSEDGSALILEGCWFGRFAKVGHRWIAAAGMRKAG